MSAATTPYKTLDLMGLPNPESILQLAQAAESWRSGDRVRVLADDKCFANDFLRWSAGYDLDVISLRYLAAGETELTLRVPGPVTIQGGLK